MKISDLKIGKRLAAGFGAVLALTGVVAVIGVTQLTSIDDATARMAEYERRKSLSLEWEKVIETNSVRTFAKAKSSSAEDQKYLDAAMTAASKRATEIQKELGTLISSEDGKRLFEAVVAQRTRYVTHRDGLFRLKEQGQDIDALVSQQLVPEMEAYVKSVADLTEYQDKLLTAAEKQAHEDFALGRNIVIGFSLLAIALGALLSWLLSRTVTVPLSAAVRHAEAVAAGDLTSEIRVESKDETGQLMQALKDMIESLQGLVGEVRTGTETITTASGEVAAGNLDLSSRTEQQASALEETASSMEELTSTVKQNAENARQANVLAASAAETAVKGGAVVSDVVETMSAINDSSKKIVDIISVIDGIAFQTNILALNAAVEAARAGEQGRGFAVVAAEVRTLAQRSASAAKEIKALIDDSVGKVQAGTTLVDEAGKTMSDVVASVKRVTDIISEISAASQEQTAGIEQINQAISQMDQVTQQNAALVEEASAAASSMQDQSAKLLQAVGAFKVRGAARAASAPAPVVHRPAPAAVRAPARAARALPVARTARPAMSGDWEEF
ncbi:methyl-accepting chemotaxis protein [Noviherbaspirillum aridicola]|uniref:Methyl-accepting chemotaxis protein n=1 Tax=Noviherbaspirillum aridicola TaxID=2849687 RepID=A0ABQ4Q6N8_9BURK|nr:methyl-accepting chemotaxis protein [Noviherbaspirillum aridicola]GIZ52818.1 methyl-accepting chemotaxis protein [Noviherbaspirillum aridicola]